jgi:hypothetical protein
LIVQKVQAIKKWCFRDGVVAIGIGAGVGAEIVV